MLLTKEEIYRKVGFSALTVDHDHSCMYESMIGQLSVTISPLGKRIQAGRTNYVTCSCLTVVQRGWKKPLAWYERKIQQSGQHSKNIQLINNWKGRFWVQMLGQWSLDQWSMTIMCESWGKSIQALCCFLDVYQKQGVYLGSHWVILAI